jgi:dolichol-phosphate mannosyltransferase
MKKLLSVIIPAYKQEKTIKKDLENIDNFLFNGLRESYNYEIICVVDGQVDQTEREAKKINSRRVKVYSYKVNHGKGYAIRYGMARSKGDLVSFLDAGMEIAPKGIMMLMAHMEWYNADIIVGSKRHPASRVNYPYVRHILSIGYHIGIKILFNLSLRDTQSGIKIFKRGVLEKILPRLLVKKYAMDIEMLAVARYLGYSRIYEAPIEVTFDKETSSISWKTVIRMILDTSAVFYRLNILHYYDDKNKANWIRDPELDIAAE